MCALPEAWYLGWVKNAADRKTVDLRIPVTVQQKAEIYAALRGVEFAGWAALRERVERREERGERRRDGEGRG